MLWGVIISLLVSVRTDFQDCSIFRSELHVGEINRCWNNWLNEVTRIMGVMKAIWIYLGACESISPTVVTTLSLWGSHDSRGIQTAELLLFHAWDILIFHFIWLWGNQDWRQRQIKKALGCVCVLKKKKILLRLVFPLYYTHSICQEQILRSVSHCIGEMRLAEFRAPKLSNLESRASL